MSGGYIWLLADFARFPHGGARGGGAAHPYRNAQGAVLPAPGEPPNIAKNPDKPDLDPISREHAMSCRRGRSDSLAMLGESLKAGRTPVLCPTLRESPKIAENPHRPDFEHILRVIALSRGEIWPFGASRDIWRALVPQLLGGCTLLATIGLYRPTDLSRCRGGLGDA